MNDNPFDADYFLRGVETGKSNFTDFKWLPDRTIPAALRLVERLSILKCDTILDFGCARGYIVKALRFMGFKAFGYDISQWAIEHADEEVREFVSNVMPTDDFDWICAKDVMEHLTEDQLAWTVRMFLHKARKGIHIVVPLAAITGGLYVSQRDNQDVTHVIHWTLCDWLQFLQRSVDDSGLPFTVQGAYKQPGLKEEITKDYPSACGFLTLRRYNT